MNEESRGTILEFKTRMINLLTQVNNRVIFTMFSSDILRIKQICDIAISQGKRIAILGIKTQKLVRIAIQQGYISIPEDKFVQLKYIDENNLNDDKDLVVIVTGERHEPYHMLQRMARGFDRLVRLNENDTM